MNYDILMPWKTLDAWQQEYIDTEENCFLLCGRQSGKTTAMSIKFGRRAATRPNRVILMIAFTEKQAYNLFFKTLMYLEACYPKELITKGKDKPTKHEINLKNGSMIICLAAGLTGEGLRTYTVTDLVIDEAAPMAREVFISVTPMLSVTGGTMDISSTPRGEEGYFYECSKRDDFVKFYISAEDCPRHKKEFLESEKKNMSSLEYAQEYLAKFLSDLKRLFPEELIKKSCILKRPNAINHGCNHYLGCDIARLGEDRGTYEIIKKVAQRKYEQVENIVTFKKLTTETEDKILELERLYSFKEIDIDAGAGTLGVSVFDHLLLEDSVKRKIVAINNRARPYDRDEKHKTKIFQEDLYNNLLRMLERGELFLLDDDEIVNSLASIQYEYVIKENQPSKLRIFSVRHSDSDIAEGLTRAAWAAAQDKGLNIYIA